jgi:hypothetical protein
MKRKSKNIITFDCYNRKTNTCDGRCQGCSSCPMAIQYQVPRKEMWEHMKQVHIKSKHWKRFEQSLKNNYSFQQEMKLLRNKLTN